MAKSQGKIKKVKRIRRHRRVRAKIYGTAERPRLCVYKSNRGMHAQIINDDKSITLFGVSQQDIKSTKGNKTDLARELGKILGQKAKEQKIMTVVFDRGGFKYHGRIKAFAESVREAGIKF